MILSRMGRWYEGPSLAEEDTAREEEAPAEPPERVPAEPIELDVPSNATPDSIGTPDSIALDADFQAGEDPAPVEEPALVPADTTTIDR